MANPGHDIHNMRADDVLSPKRQQEIAQLIEVLKQFHPTKIAIEADVGSQRVAQAWLLIAARQVATPIAESKILAVPLTRRPMCTPLRSEVCPTHGELARFRR